MNRKKIGVYGLGRFGAFWAQCLSAQAVVSGYSRSDQRPTPAGVARVSESDLFKAQTIILCNSISSMTQVAERIKDRLSGGSLVMDTCSVKIHPLAVLAKTLPQTVELLGTHPMFGPDSARNGLKGLPIILSPVRVKNQTLDVWVDFFRKMGLAIHIMTPEEHDHQAAYTQGITHYIGRVLKDLDLTPSPIGTLGYQKLLEIVEQTCNDPWQLFLDIQIFNPYTKEMREKLHHSLAKIFEKLAGSVDFPVDRT